MRIVRLIRFFCLLIYFCFAAFSALAQDVTGIWRGYFTQDNGEQYKLEFQVKQTKSGAYVVSGVSYSYLDVRFYGKASMTGTFIKKEKQLKIREIKTVEIKSSTGGGVCIMNYNLAFSQSGREQFLEGSYLGKPEVKGRENPYQWGDCGGGKVYLRKVTTSDFYTEPFLRSNPVTKAPVKKPANTVTKAPVTKKPAATPPVVKKTTPPATKKTIPPQQKKPVVIPKDTAKKIIEEVKPPVVKKTEIPPPPVIKNRQNELVKVLQVKSPVVKVRLYDNGEIDGDTISVFLNNKLILSKQRLTAAPLSISLNMTGEEVQELVMVAENLGSIPPNTSLMVVESGDKRYEVRITSTEQKNAVVRFKYQPQ